MLSSLEIVELDVGWADAGGDLAVDNDEVHGDNDDDERGQEHRDGGVEHVVLPQVFASNGIKVLTFSSFGIQKNDQTRNNKQN